MTRSCVWAPGPEPCRRAPLPGMAACASHLPRAFRAFATVPAPAPGAELPPGSAHRQSGERPLEARA